MSTPGSLSAGLAYLPNWLADCPDAVALDALLCGWVRASDYRAVGIDWPDAETLPDLTATAEGVERFAADASPARANPTATPLPASVARLATALVPPNRGPGVLWAERSGTTPWTDDDRNYLQLSARLIERSPALYGDLKALLGPGCLSP